MRLAKLYVAVALACSACLAQEICHIPKRGPSADATVAFEKIQDAVGIDPGTILLYASSDPLVVASSGAVSTECPGGKGLELWIVYDPDLIKGDALYFALAHEAAHQVNHDPMSGVTPSKQTELRADGFAARYLTRPPLSWTSQKLMQALNALPLPDDARGTYPSLAERRAQVNTGYALESARLHPNPGPDLPPQPGPDTDRDKAASVLSDLSGSWEISEGGVIRLARTNSGYVGTLVKQTSDLTIKDTKATPGKTVLTLDRQMGPLTLDSYHYWSYEYEATLVYYGTGSCSNGVPVNGLIAKVTLVGQEKHISLSNAGFNFLQYVSSDRSCRLRKVGGDSGEIVLSQAPRP